MPFHELCLYGFRELALTGPAIRVTSDLKRPVWNTPDTVAVVGVSVVVHPPTEDTAEVAVAIARTRQVGQTAVLVKGGDVEFSRQTGFLSTSQQETCRRNLIQIKLLNDNLWRRNTWNT